MKTVIAGSRKIKDYSELLTAILHCSFDITEVVCGMAVGVDQMGEKWARVNNLPVKEMPADWNKHGKPAGPIRNRQMILYADCAIILWDGKSEGTRNLIENCIRYKKPYFLRLIKDSSLDRFFE